LERVLLSGVEPQQEIESVEMGAFQEEKWQQELAQDVEERGPDGR